jgi:hypothetical protein
MDMMRFEKLCRIEALEPNSWQGKFFLTFDIDWAHDQILTDTINLVLSFNVPATWFTTHATPVLESIRRSQLFELGIHPNFNPLLSGKGGVNCAQVIKELKRLVPDAKSCRSHSVADGAVIRSALRAEGITHESNINIPEETGIALRPFLGSCGLTRVPYCWADEHAFTGSQSDDFHDISRRMSLVVFDFHPIHVFLNTESSDRYERTRHLHQNPTELIKHRYEGYGTRNRLLDLLAFGVKDVAVDTTGEDT